MLLYTSFASILFMCCNVVLGAKNVGDCSVPGLEKYLKYSKKIYYAKIQASLAVRNLKVKSKPKEHL